MKTKIFLLATTCIICVLTAQAQNKPTQKQRVKQGVKAGTVTKAEAEKIKEERKDVKAEIKEAKADGVVTKEEKMDIKKEREQTNKAIRRSKKNKNIQN